MRSWLKKEEQSLNYSSKFKCSNVRGTDWFIRVIFNQQVLIQTERHNDGIYLHDAKQNNFIIVLTIENSLVELL